MKKEPQFFKAFTGKVVKDVHTKEIAVLVYLVAILSMLAKCRFHRTR